MTDEKALTTRPKAKSQLGETELEKAQNQFDAFDQNIKEMTMDRMNLTPKQESEPQTKISQGELAHLKDVYLKPKRTVGCRDKFNEKFRESYNFDKEYVQFQAENKEIIGETISIWTRPYGGMAAEEWDVPVNTPVWGPRYLAEQIKRKSYHRLVMKERPTGSDQMGSQYYGTMAVDTTIQRLDATPVIKKRSIFMGNTNF